MITTVLCYSATLGIAVTVYDTPCRVDMGNVGEMVSAFRQFIGSNAMMAYLVPNSPPNIVGVAFVNLRPC